MAAAVKLKLWPHLPGDSPGFLRTAVETSGKERERAKRSIALATLYNHFCMLHPHMQKNQTPNTLAIM